METFTPKPSKNDGELVFALTFWYFVFGACFIWLTWQQKVVLYNGISVRFPSMWLLGLWFYYYILPFVIAVSSGFYLGPVRYYIVALLLAIFSVHAAYSLTLAELRGYYLSEWRKDISLNQLLQVQYSRPELQDQDENLDGLIDRVDVLSHFLVRGGTSGTYTIRYQISQNGKMLSAGGFKDISLEDGS